MEKTMKMLLSLILVSMFIPYEISPCSIFKYSRDGKTFFCGNEDWIFTNPAIQSYPPLDNNYGYVLLGWKNYLPRYAQAGINSEGLCFDWAVVPPQKYAIDNTKPIKTIDCTIEILRTCKDIADVMSFVQKNNIPHLAEEHIMFTDKKGQSCVIEYNEGKMKIIQNKTEYQFITNFHISNPDLGWSPCDRYSRMEEFFNEQGDKENRLMELLYEVHQENQYPTIYSYIFNLDRMEIEVFFNHNYNSSKLYSIKNLLKGKETIDID
jgi:hypothetical protein